jgi:hypothetical protein
MSSERNQTALIEYEQRRNRAGQGRGRASIPTNITALLKSGKVCATFIMKNKEAFGKKLYQRWLTCLEEELAVLYRTLEEYTPSDAN